MLKFEVFHIHVQNSLDNQTTKSHKIIRTIQQLPLERACTLREFLCRISRGNMTVLRAHSNEYKILQGSTMRTLWREILCASVPITLHNGLIDLVFIYQHFYSVLPETFTEFVANISDWFLLPERIPGLYDSKYIAEYINRFKASFLEYVFRKWFFFFLVISEFDSFV